MRKNVTMLSFFFLVALCLTGCATKLVVHGVDENPNKFKGIRVRIPVSYIVTKEIKTEKCPDRTVEEIVHLPFGDAYDINFAPAIFAKSEFSIHFNDNGVLKQVTLNSTPQTPETIKALGELTEKVAGVVPLIKEDCGPVVSEKIISVRKFELTK